MSVVITQNITENGTYFNREKIEIEVESDQFLGASPPYTPGFANLRPYLELYDKDADPDALIAAIRGSYNFNTKRAKFDLGDLADLSAELPTEASLTGTPIASGMAANSVKLVYFKYGDSYGTPPEPESPLSQGDDFYLITGRRSYLNNPDTLIPYDPTNPVIILHSWQGSKTVTEDQPDYLYFYSQEAMTVNIFIELLFEDGTTSSSLADSIATEANKVYWIQAGISQLNIDQESLFGYTLRLQKAGSVNSRERSYEIDRVCQDFGIFLLYETGLGGMETIHLKGKAEQRYQTESELFTNSQGEKSLNRPSGNMVLRANSGYYARHELDTLQQILHSPKVYLISDDKFIPHVITNDRIRTAQDDEELLSIQLDIEPAWDNESYTNLVLPV